MKILRVISSLNPATGGPCQGIRNTIPELKKLNVSNEVVCLDDPDASFLKNESFLIHALGTGKGPWNYNKNLIPWLKENICNYDVVIVHGLWLYHSFAVKQVHSWFLNNGKKGCNHIPKLFVMPHGMLDPYFQKDKSRRLKAIRNWFFWKLIEGSVVNKANGILFTCEIELELARESFRPYRPNKELNVGYGILKPPLFQQDMQQSFKDKCPHLKNRPYLLFLSRIHEKKGIDLLIKAYIHITNKINDCREAVMISDRGVIQDQDPEWPVLVVAGPGLDTPFGEKMQQLAKDCNDDGSILFPGMLTGDAKWGAFYGCEAFILPSHQENFGIVVVEALACSKPVIISNQVNIWKEIEAHDCGFVDEDTVDGMIKSFKWWQKLSIGEKIDIRIKARNCYENKFAIKPHVLKLLNAIRETKT